MAPEAGKTQTLHGEGLVQPFLEASGGAGVVPCQLCCECFEGLGGCVCLRFLIRLPSALADPIVGGFRQVIEYIPLFVHWAALDEDVIPQTSCTALAQALAPSMTTSNPCAAVRPRVMRSCKKVMTTV